MLKDKIIRKINGLNEEENENLLTIINHMLSTNNLSEIERAELNGISLPFTSFKIKDSNRNSVIGIEEQFVISTSDIEKFMIDYIQLQKKYTDKVTIDF